MSPLANFDQAHLEEKTTQCNDCVVIGKDGLANLIASLIHRGYQVVGPRLRDGAIIYDRLGSVEDLPAGWTDNQTPANYRLSRRSDEALFGYAVGPHSWKRFLYPPVQRLFRVERLSRGFQTTPEAPPGERFAFIGVRSCELHAIAALDQVFLSGQYVDPNYKSLRENLFIVAVNCAQAGGTCFCASMNTGPKATFGYDLALTELLHDGDIRYLIEAGSEQGAELLEQIPHEAAGENDLNAADQALAATASHMGRSLDTHGIRELLSRNFESPLWEAIEARCLSCANCTMVCPTCFCTTVEDTTDLTGSRAERWRRWDSCFTLDFSYIHGGSVRVSTKSRFRQWMTHKLSAWIDQFGTSGCVGCGRCITWCPVGIDITAEAKAIRESEMPAPPEFSRSSHDNSNA